MNSDFEYVIGIDLGIHTQDKETAAICKKFSDGSIQILDICHNIDSLSLKVYYPLTVIATEEDIEALRVRGIIKENTRVKIC